MKLESIRIKNFKVLKDVNLCNIPNLAVILGANGSGKTTFFEVFAFLKDAMNTNVHAALLKYGGSKGFDEVKSRDSEGDIEIELSFRIKEIEGNPLITYSVCIGKDAQGRDIVEKEVLKSYPGDGSAPIDLLNFSKGQGSAVNFKDLDPSKKGGMVIEDQKLKSPDILAIKGLAQFKEFAVIVVLGDIISNWHIADIQISTARGEQKAVAAEHLSTSGDNLFSVIDDYHDHFPETLEKIKESLKRCVPGVAGLEVRMQKETGQMRLEIQDEFFKEPFLSERVSHGTIRILNYLVLLHDPNPHRFLFIEEPENHLYYSLLEELAEEFRDYARRGGQVFVSTHSPDLLNSAELEEVFFFVKKEGFTTVVPAAEDKQIKRYMDNGDKMGYLWKEGFFRGVDPK